MNAANVLVSARGALEAGPVRILCHRRWHAVVSLTRGLGADERPDLYVEWPARSLLDRQHGRLGLLEGRYDPRLHRLYEPRYTTLSIAQAQALSPVVDELTAVEDARWSRSAIGRSLPELVRVGVLPGPGALDSLLKQLAPEPADRMPAQVVGASPPAVRPELLLSLMVVERRRPELVRAHRRRVKAKVRLALARMTPEQRSRHAAEAAHATWSILADRAGALELLAGWSAPAQTMQVNHHGAEALALPAELVFRHLAGRDLASDTARALLKRHLLDPVANEVDLDSVVPAPAAFLGALPAIDERWIRLAADSPEDATREALVGQFTSWTRVGGALVAAAAGAGVDRMPLVGRRPPDPRGVRARVHIITTTARAQGVSIGTPMISWRDGSPRPASLRAKLPSDIPGWSAMTMDLGALDDEPLEPGAPFRIELPVHIAEAGHRFVLRGTVGVAY